MSTSNDYKDDDYFMAEARRMVSEPTLFDRITKGDPSIAEPSKIKQSFVTKDLYKLEQASDSERWDPSNYIRERIKNFDDIAITLVDNNCDNNTIQEIKEKLIEDVNIGFVVLGKYINRHHKPPYIALTTSHTIYLIDTNNKAGIQFLRKILEHTTVRFWTTQGLYEADCLFNTLNIDLHKATGCQDCLEIHCKMMIYLAVQSDSMLSYYPKLACEKSKMKPRMESWPNLVEIWLDIPKEEIEINSSQLEHILHIKTTGLTTTAKNVILKRCILVRELAGTLNLYWQKDLKILSSSFHRRLSYAPNEKLHEFLLKSMIISENAEREEDKAKEYESPKINPEAVAHLGFGNFHEE